VIVQGAGSREPSAVQGAAPGAAPLRA